MAAKDELTQNLTILMNEFVKFGRTKTGFFDEVKQYIDIFNKMDANKLKKCLTAWNRCRPEIMNSGEYNKWDVSRMYNVFGSENKKDIVEKFIQAVTKYPDIASAIMGVYRDFRNMRDNTPEMNEYIYTNIESLKIAGYSIPFYHGTSYRNYQKIIESKIIMTSTHPDMRGDLSEQLELNKKFVETAKNRTFFTDSYDTALYYCLDNRGANHHSSDAAPALSGAEFVETLTMDEHRYHGVILEVDLSEYEINTLPLRNEYYVNGDVRINAIKKVYHVFFDNGVLSIRTDNGEEITE